MTPWDFDEELGGTFAEDVPLEERLAAVTPADDEDV